MVSTMWNLFTFISFSILASIASAQNDECSWTSLGCFTHESDTPVLRYAVVPSTTSDTNFENCEAACAAQNYPVSGVEDGFNCWCDVAVQGGATPKSASYCNSPCYGDPSEICGGYTFLSVYENTCIAPSSSIPASTPSSTWTWGWTISLPSSSASSYASSRNTACLTTSSALSLSGPATSVPGSSIPGTTFTAPIGYTTSTVTETLIYTISSCQATVKSCPYGSTTTETRSLATVLPVTPTALAPPLTKTQSTQYASLSQTKTHTSPLTSSGSSSTVASSAPAGLPGTNTTGSAQPKASPSSVQIGVGSIVRLGSSDVLVWGLLSVAFAFMLL
ncbi:uncharacterized protein LY89DRAFT_53229 [Mollisia scopiformis]|uniref:WSC domain-containing protein n=1 Tax=Mollisia scopiformis TaxID=149040 RepID=A0A194XB87_MOLSC|nr:uncharacterized protein LY89DRAFT_53229 [Mollisia scopiformis]KUJ17428.1 hypothetical protein LY89DRAFT_53229 [Mollisia scopiformis]